MNQFYNLEEKSISQNINNHKELKTSPSDMVINNILNYSRALQVIKSNDVKQQKVENFHLILN